MLSYSKKKNLWNNFNNIIRVIFINIVFELDTQIMALIDWSDGIISNAKVYNI